MKTVDTDDVNEEGYYWYRERGYDPEETEDPEWQIVKLFHPSYDPMGLWMMRVGDEMPTTCFDGTLKGPLTP